MTSREITLCVWALLGLIAVLIVCVPALWPGPGMRLATPRVAVAEVASKLAGRILLVLGWMWLGWHLFAR